THLERNLPQFSVSIPNYLDWTTRAQSWTFLAASTERAMNLTGGSEPEVMQVRMVTASFFPTLGVTPGLGRSFSEAEDSPGGESVALLSTALGQRRFGAVPSVVGQTIQLDGAPYTIVGVITSDAIPVGFDVLIPLAPNPATEDRMDHYL